MNNCNVVFEEIKVNKLNVCTKRIFDFIISLIGLIIMSPVFIAISLFIKIDSQGPVFFKQKRVGQNEKIFQIYKFRTMVVNAEALGKQITVGSRDPRVTRLGYFLRKYKFDELPQLLNVLKGEMSLVGPRPEVPKYVELYSKAQKRVFMVKPGITDLASIEYSDENDILDNVEEPEKYYIEKIMPHKLALNIEYIKKCNVFVDIGLIIKTILKCFK